MVANLPDWLPAGFDRRRRRFGFDAAASNALSLAYLCFHFSQIASGFAHPLCRHFTVFSAAVVAAVAARRHNLRQVQAASLEHALAQYSMF